MTDELQTRSNFESTIRARLIELIRLSTEHGIDIEGLMYQALAICDAEPN